MRDRIEESRHIARGPVRGLLGVLVLVVAFLAVLAAATFLVYFIME